MIGSIWFMGQRRPTLWSTSSDDRDGVKPREGDIVLVLMGPDQEEGLVTVLSGDVGVKRMYASWLKPDALARVS